MKCPDLTSRELQKYVGEKASDIIPNLVRLGLKIQSKEHFEGKATEAASQSDIEIRFDKKTGEIIRIWRGH